MEITWYGHSCFRIVERRYASVVTDPYNHEAIGYFPLKLSADIVTVSHDAPGHNHVAAVRKVHQVINGPGEYEIGGVFVSGIRNGDKDNRNTIYVFDFENITVAHLGDIRSVPTQSQVEAMGTINVLLLPVGGGGSLNAARAAEVVSQIEPNIVIPMHYATPHCTLKLDSLERFLKEMGVNKIEQQPSLKVSASVFKSEESQTRVVVLDYMRE